MIQRNPQYGIFFRMDSRGGVQSCVLALLKELNKRGYVPELVWDVAPNQKLLDESGVRASFRKVRFAIPTQIIDRLPDMLRYLPIAINGIGSRKFFSADQKVVSFVNWLHPKSADKVIYYCSGPPLLPQLEPPHEGLKHFIKELQSKIYKIFIRKYSPAYEVHKESKCFINSDYTARLLSEAHGFKMPVLYPPIEAASCPEAYSGKSKRDSVLFFSRIVHYKRPDLIISLAKIYPRIRFVIAGGVSTNRIGYYKQLRDSAESLSNLYFLPNASSQDIESEFSRAKIYVFPAKDEHFGMTTAEAIARGVCPFVHNSGGQKDLVQNPLLRFDYDEFEKKFSHLVALGDSELSELHASCQSVLSKLTADNFCRRILGEH